MNIPNTPIPAVLHVDLKRLQDAVDYIDQINKTPLHQIAWYRDGVYVPVRQTWVTEWRLVGLNNRDFARQYLLRKPLA